MGLLANLDEWVNGFGKKRCRSLFWRMRSAVKKAFKNNNGGKKQIKFQYDPSSYALNFDDGTCHHLIRDAAKMFMADATVHELPDIHNNTTWVYVIWVKTK
ncbi:hypothetical protein HN51_057792 [Arachis hypogaea]|uniref:Uncharacterized protein n=1 Tax=Arachis hypogaea TaxID=3818 RepID=A0A444WYF0_ARAHY|nr:uncharacterized protein DS421_20g682140 [Arachis hypogaea]RYQ82413.1 hypothetical protein Ahy_B10g101007 [Arachis hypogaea]